MQKVSAVVSGRDMDRARRVLAGHVLPRGIADVQVEAAEDQDGDPVMWVWLDGEDTSRWSAMRREELSAFLARLKRELYDELEEYRPHFRMRTLASPRS